MELGDVVTDEAALHSFVGGLKPDIKMWVLMDRTITTLLEATQCADRVELAKKGASSGDRDHSTPMDLDLMQGQNQGRRQGGG